MERWFIQSTRRAASRNPARYSRLSGRKPETLLICILLTACSPANPLAERVSEYTERLARVLEVETPASAAVVLPGLPRPRDLAWTLPDQRVDGLDFLRLGDCELQQHVAAHNASLGKLAGASQQLIYHLNFLRTAPACIAHLEGEQPELAATLGAAYESRIEVLPQLAWQAMLGGPEFRQLWQQPVDLPLAPAPEPGTAEALSELTELARTWLAGNYQADGQRLEQLLGALRHARLGEQLALWAVLGNGLRDASRVLDNRDRPLCFPDMQTPRASWFRNVVSEYFVKAIQPVGAKLGRQYFDLFPRVQALEAILASGEPAAYQAWRQQRDQLVEAYQAAIPDHVRKLSVLFEQCGMTPGQRAD